MKSPEEIKKGLAYCDSRDNMFKGCAGGCPYWCDKSGCHSTEMKIDALAYIQQLENQIADVGKTSTRWISVKKRLPENGQKVIAAFRNSGGWIVDQARYSNGEFDFASWAYVWDDNITHWMPLPKPPEVEEHE